MNGHASSHGDREQEQRWSLPQAPPQVGDVRPGTVPPIAYIFQKDIFPEVYQVNIPILVGNGLSHPLANLEDILRPRKCPGNVHKMSQDIYANEARSP